MTMAVTPAENMVWKFEKTLGSGGFGSVLLYKNEETGELLAVKQCRQTTDLSDKARSRWADECRMMIRLSHPNVVQGLHLPAELQNLAAADLPVLAMEYCAFGDLRKVLNRPENSRGLPEYQVRHIVRDTSAAVEYLHSQRVIHRDLKPENIVMKAADPGRVVYKLIDLGYAKDLTNDSMCISFVGTTQYLAPELFTAGVSPQSSKSYTNTVDYWSLGTTVFECIVGSRPFYLNNLNFVRWLTIVAGKRYEHICATLTEAGSVEYGDKLPQPNHLNSVSQAYFEQWLRLMLQYDPKNRGEKPNQSSSSTNGQRPYCFVFLDMILSTRLIHIYNAISGDVMATPVNTSVAEAPAKSVSVLSEIIEKSWHIECSDQVLVALSGKLLGPADNLSEFYSVETVDKSRDVIELFLFSKSCKRSVGDKKLKPLPEQLKLMLVNRHMDRTFTDQADVCKHLIYYCSRTITDFERLNTAAAVAVSSLVQHHTEMSALLNQLHSDLTAVLSAVDFFKISTETDLDQLRDQQRRNGTFSQQMCDSWSNWCEEVTKYYSLISDVGRLNTDRDSLTSRIEKIRISLTNGVNISQLQEILQKSKQLFEELKCTPQDQRNKVAKSGTIVEYIEQFQQVSIMVISHLDSVIREAILSTSDVVKTRQKMQDILFRLPTIKENVYRYQQQRQKNIWRLMSRVQEAKDQSASKADDGESLTTWNQECETLHGESSHYQTRLDSLVQTLSENFRQHKEQFVESDWSFLDA